MPVVLLVYMTFIVCSVLLLYSVNTILAFATTVQASSPMVL